MYGFGMFFNLLKPELSQLQNWENTEGDLATSHRFQKLWDNMLFAIYIQISFINIKINCISL